MVLSENWGSWREGSELSPHQMGDWRTAVKLPLRVSGRSPGFLKDFLHFSYSGIDAVKCLFSTPPSDINAAISEHEYRLGWYMLSSCSTGTSAVRWTGWQVLIIDSHCVRFAVSNECDFVSPTLIDSSQVCRALLSRTSCSMYAAQAYVVSHISTSHYV